MEEWTKEEQLDERYPNDGHCPRVAELPRTEKRYRMTERLLPFDLDERMRRRNVNQVERQG